MNHFRNPSVTKYQKALASDTTGTSKHALEHQLMPLHLANNMPHLQNDTRDAADSEDTQEKDSTAVHEPKHY